jgi:antitoxin component of MazEF toxin-antitoxin module
MRVSTTITLERTVFVTGNSLRVNIHEPVAKALELKAGDKVLISLNDHQMLLEKAKKAK